MTRRTVTPEAFHENAVKKVMDAHALAYPLPEGESVAAAWEAMEPARVAWAEACSACPECERCRRAEWPPSRMCDEHYRSHTRLYEGREKRMLKAHAWEDAVRRRADFEASIRDAMAQVAQVYACDTDDGPLPGEESIVRRPRS